MDNNIIDHLCQSLTAGVRRVSFKFNFRGVNESQGNFGDGSGAADDVKASISFNYLKKPSIPAAWDWQATRQGWTWVLATACDDDRVKVLAAIFPPLSMFDYSCLDHCTKPKLFISGTEDQFVPAKPFLGFCQSFPNPKECFTIEAADHFWWGYESSLTEKVTELLGQLVINFHLLIKW